MFQFTVGDLAWSKCLYLNVLGEMLLECHTILINGQAPSTVSFYYTLLVFSSAKVCHAQKHVALTQSV